MIFNVCFCWYKPYDHKAKIYLQQHLPESTILHQFAAKKKKIPGDPPLKKSWERAYM